MRADQPKSMVMVRIGGMEYPAVNEKRCNVCQSPHRVWIENELIRGRSVHGILRDLDGFDHHGRKVPSFQSITSHSKKHLPIGPATERRIIERRADEIANAEDPNDPLIDYITLNEMIVQKGFDRIQRGDIQVSARDALEASKFLREVERQTAGDELNSQIWADALMAYMEIAMQFVPVESREEFGRALAESPVLKTLAKRQQELKQSQSGL